MPLNGTDSQQVKKAAEELASKRNLEAQFIRDLNRVFKVMGADLLNTVANTPGTINANIYINDIKRVLETNYTRVQKRFSSELFKYLWANRSNLKESFISDLSKIAEARNVTTSDLLKLLKRNTQKGLLAFKEFNVTTSTDAIITTTQKEVERAIKSAEVFLTDKHGENNFSRAQLAKATRSAFIARQNIRSKLIAATETQKAAEGAKQIERDAFLAIRNGNTAKELNLPLAELIERWVTQGDSLVRDGSNTIFNHLEADGQLKENGIYIVSGERLRFPGDNSLGASLGNTIRSRCSSIIVIK